MAARRAVLYDIDPDSVLYQGRVGVNGVLNNLLEHEKAGKPRQKIHTLVVSDNSSTSFSCALF